MSLEGKTAVVTGAAKGMGRAFCARLAADGANVVGMDLIDATDQLQALGGPGSKLALTCDITSAEEVAAARNTVEERYGRCDILVNNAGIYPTQPFDRLTLEDFQRVLRTNVDSMLILALAFTPAMRGAGWGRIVNLGSGVTSLQNVDMLPYITSKGAVHAFTRALANELGTSAITVNALAPSIVPTEGLAERASGVGGMTSDEEVDFVSSLQTVKRRSSPDDLADALSFLVSEDAGFITGQILHVDGGLTRSGA